MTFAFLRPKIPGRQKSTKLSVCLVIQRVSQQAWTVEQIKTATWNNPYIFRTGCSMSPYDSCKSIPVSDRDFPVSQVNSLLHQFFGMRSAAKKTKIGRHL